MAERTAQQVLTALKNQLIVYDPAEDAPPDQRFRQIIGGALGSQYIPLEQAAKAAGVSTDVLNRLAPEIEASNYGPYINDRTALYQKYITPGRSTGFFSSLLGGVGGVVGGLADTIVDPVANALNVHPDAIKAAAALAGMYYAGEGLFFDAATNAIVPEAVATDMVAATLGAESLAVPAAASAAAPAAATAFPVATAPLGAMGAATPFTATDLAALGAESLAVPVATNALAPTVAATAAGANALPGAAALSPEALAAYDASVGLTAGGGVPAAATGAAATGATGMFDPASALETQLAVTPAAAGALGAAGAGAAGAAGAGALGANALVPLALAGTGVLGAVTAQSAAETQAAAARYAADQAYKIYQEQKALQEPFRTAGITAQNQLLTLLGLQGGTPGAEFGRYARPFGMQDFQADPGYAFRLSEGMKALEASRAARGGLLSGATGKALSRYGQDLASQEYGSAFNRYQTERANRLAPLGSLMGTGQAAAANQAGSAGQYGTNLSNLTTSGAAAQAAGQVGMMNALTGSLNTYLNYSANQNIANALQEAATRRASMYGPAIS